MRIWIAATVAALTLSLGSAVPTATTTTSKHVLHEKRDARPHAWQKRHRAMSDYVMPIRIALRERNTENADRYIYDVADPRSPNFGKDQNWKCWVQ